MGRQFAGCRCSLLPMGRRIVLQIRKAFLPRPPASSVGGFINVVPLAARALGRRPPLAGGNCRRVMVPHFGVWYAPFRFKWRCRSSLSFGRIFRPPGGRRFWQTCGKATPRGRQGRLEALSGPVDCRTAEFRTYVQGEPCVSGFCRSPSPPLARGRLPCFFPGRSNPPPGACFERKGGDTRLKPVRRKTCAACRTAGRAWGRPAFPFCPRKKKAGSQDFMARAAPRGGALLDVGRFSDGFPLAPVGRAKWSAI